MSLPLAFGNNPSKRYQQSGNFEAGRISFRDLTIQKIYHPTRNLFK